MTDVWGDEELDALFDSGEDRSNLFDWDKAFHDCGGSCAIDMAVKATMPETMSDIPTKTAARTGQA